MLEKMKFWKKDDEFTTDSGTSEPPHYDLGARKFDDPSFGQQNAQQPFGQQAYPQESSFSQASAQYPPTTPFPGTAQAPQQQFATQDLHPRDIELILAKLDAIKSELDALHQRIRKIEQVGDQQQAQKQRSW